MKIKKMKKMNENLEELNGKPEDRIVIPEGQEYLGGTGFTSIFYVKDIIDGTRLVKESYYNNQSVQSCIDYIFECESIGNK